MSTSEFNMSAEPQEFGPFSLILPRDQGGERQFVLREVSEKAHAAYKAVTTKAMRMSMTESEERTAKIEGGEEADATLVASCLYPVVDGQVSPNPSTLPFVLGLPRRITKRLYLKVRELSGMDEDEETAEFLTKRIASDQRKLDRLKSTGAPGKSAPSTTQPISA